VRERRVALDLGADVGRAVPEQRTVAADARAEADARNTEIERRNRRSVCIEGEGRPERRGLAWRSRARRRQAALDHAKLRRCLLRVGRDHEIRLSGDPGAVGDAPAFAAPVARVRARADPVLLLVFEAEQHVAAAIVGEAAAPCERGVSLATVALGSFAVVDLCLEAFEILVEDHVDDARDGVGPVLRRGAARHDLGPLDEHRRDQRQVDGAAFRGRNDAFRVDQRQRPRAEERIQAAQICELRADVEVADADVRLGEERRVLRQRPNDVADVGQAQVLDLLRIDRGQRLRRIETATADARARDNDLLGVLRSCEQRRRRDGGGQNGQTQVGAARRLASRRPITNRHRLPPMFAVFERAERNGAMAGAIVDT
jgi:hypothetical protein